MKNKTFKRIVYRGKVRLEFARDVVVQVHLIAGKHVIIVMVQVQ